MIVGVDSRDVRVDFAAALVASELERFSIAVLPEGIGERSALGEYDRTDLGQGLCVAGGGVTRLCKRHHRRHVNALGVDLALSGFAEDAALTEPFLSFVCSRPAFKVAMSSSLDLA